MPLWPDSLTLVGLACLTFGTGAQAWASRADFKSLAAAYEKVRQDEAKTNVLLSLIALFVMWMISTQPDNRTPDRSLNAWLKMAILGGWYIWRNATWSVLRWPWYARRIRAMGGDDALAVAVSDHEIEQCGACCDHVIDHPDHVIDHGQGVRVGVDLVIGK
jgi:hypothetical protein